MKKYGLVVIASAASALVLGTALHAAGDRRKPGAPREVTMTGQVVDLHSYMTGTFASSDKRKCTQQSLQAGVPAALETEEGLVLLGAGDKGPARTIAPFAFTRIEVIGMLHEKEGVRYLDVKSAKPAKADDEADETENQPGSEDEKHGLDDAELNAEGACCFTDGDCMDLTRSECAEENGAFHRGATCDTVECDR